MLRAMRFPAALAAVFLIVGASASFAQVPPASQAPANAPAPSAPAAPAAPSAPSGPGARVAAPTPSAAAPSGPAGPSETKRARSYRSCIRAARKRALRGAVRRRFVARCQLGYESPAKPSGAR